ncbi:MAG: sigma 54-interacting transcriptional regulator [Fibrobacterota bacterium]
MAHPTPDSMDKYFDDIFKYYDDPVILYRRDGTILKANEGIRTSLGYGTDEIVGTPLFSLIEKSSGLLDGFLMPGKERGFYLRLKPGIDMTRVSGRIGFLPANLYSVKASALVLPAGEDRLLAVFTLLPQRLSAHYTDPFTDLIVIADPTHRVLEYNNAFFSRFSNAVQKPCFHGLSLEEVFGAPTWHLILSKREEAARKIFESADASRFPWRSLFDGPFRETDWFLEAPAQWSFRDGMLVNIRPVFFTSAILHRPVDAGAFDFRAEFEACGEERVSFFTFFCGKQRAYEGTPDTSGYLAGVRGPGPQEARAASIFKKQGVEMVTKFCAPLASGAWHTFAVEKAGARFRLFCNHEQVIEYADMDPVSNPLLSAFGLCASDRVAYRDLKLLTRPASVATVADALDSVSVVFPHMPESVYEVHATVSQQREDPVLIYRLRDITRARKAEAALLQTHRREKRLQRENRQLRERLHEGAPALVGVSPALERLRKRIADLADTDATVFITGETGTGKDVVARALHAAGPRAAQPFVKVDCAALPPALLETELFGHEKGAFTGASGQRVGRFELAGAGSVFLDEIGNLDLALQSKLLRVLQDRVFERVGGTETLPVRARILCATNMDLPRLIREGRFREDLYYRINVIRLPVPLLRDRPEDIPALIRHFAAEVCGRNNRPVPRFEPVAEAALASFSWPGNVRELKNAVEYAVLLCRNETVRSADLPPGLGGADAGSLHRRDRVKPRKVPKEDVLAALFIAGNNRKQAAKLLKLPRESFYRLLKKYKVSKKRRD